MTCYRLIWPDFYWRRIIRLDELAYELGKHSSSSDNPYVSEQPHLQGLLGVQNGSSEKTLANRRSRVSKNIGDFDCFKSAMGFVIG